MEYARDEHEVPPPLREPIERIRAALRGLRYGRVTAVVQPGRIVQVERTEKIRLDRTESQGK